MTDTSAEELHSPLTTVWIGLALAFVLWTINFGGDFWTNKVGLDNLNFWLLMTISTFLLGGLAVYWDRRTIAVRMKWWKIITIGVSSAFVLYLIFYVGDIITSWLPMQDKQVSAVYSTRTQAPESLIIGLLIFPIASGEEVFWRGFIQRRFEYRYGWKTALLVTTLCYGLVHIASGNLMLIGAAVVCGLFWGMLYRVAGCIWPGIISHIVWDVLIFALLPLR